MFAYCIIGIELAILYLVFWIVFIREPKPREIRAELWGRYQNSDRQNTSSNRQSKLPEYLFLDQKELNSCLPRRSEASPYRMAKAHKRHNRHTMHTHSPPCSCVCHEASAATSRYRGRGQFVQSRRQQQNNRDLAERFLLLLNRTLNNFSVKVP